MKTLLTRSTVATFLASYAAVIALAVMLDTSSRAGEPLKGGERLNGTRVVRSLAPAKSGSAGPTQASSCGQCATVRPTKSVATTKAGERLVGGRPALLGGAHGCNDCVTSLDVTGHGKAKATQVRHSCSMPGTAAGGRCAPAKL